MKNLIQDLEAIEVQHKEFFEKNHVRLYHYVYISKKPVMLWFNKETDSKCRLPNDIYDKLNALIMSYYGKIG
jgi:hypothetical protein